MTLWTFGSLSGLIRTALPEVQVLRRQGYQSCLTPPMGQWRKSSRVLLPGDLDMLVEAQTRGQNLVQHEGVQQQNSPGRWTHVLVGQPAWWDTCPDGTVCSASEAHVFSVHETWASAQMSYCLLTLAKWD